MGLWLSAWGRGTTQRTLARVSAFVSPKRELPTDLGVTLELTCYRMMSPREEGGRNGLTWSVSAWSNLICAGSGRLGTVYPRLPPRAQAQAVWPGERGAQAVLCLCDHRHTHSGGATILTWPGPCLL